MSIKRKKIKETKLEDPPTPFKTPVKLLPKFSKFRRCLDSIDDQFPTRKSQGSYHTHSIKIGLFSVLAGKIIIDIRALPARFEMSGYGGWVEGALATLGYYFGVVWSKWHHGRRYFKRRFEGMGWNLKEMDQGFKIRETRRGCGVILAWVGGSDVRQRRLRWWSLVRGM